MTLKEQILKDKISAMKEKNTDKKNVLSVLLGDIETTKYKKGRELTEEEIVKMVKKMISNNVITNDVNENEYLDTYIPKEMTDKELSNLINEYVKMNDISTMKEMGKVMGYLSSKFANKFNGANASKIVKSILS